MKKIIIIAGLLMGNITQAKDLNILFIGNSMTASAGGQQELVAALLRSQRWTVQTADSYGPGMTLAGHWFNNQGKMDRWRNDQIERNLQRIAESKGTSDSYDRDWENEHERRDSFLERKGHLDRALAAQPKWDIVTLQASSNEPKDPDYYQTHEAAPELVQKIREHSPEAKIIFYQPWPYNATGKETPLYSAFRKDMVERYQLHDFIPMMEAMLHARAERTDLAIHRKEGDVHPGYDGGYLIACLFYSAITGESPIGLPAAFTVEETYDHKKTDFAISAEAAAFLQETAWKFFQKRDEL